MKTIRSATPSPSTFDNRFSPPEQPERLLGGHRDLYAGVQRAARRVVSLPAAIELPKKTVRDETKIAVTPTDAATVLSASPSIYAKVRASLNAKNLELFKKVGIETPEYDRAAVREGIVHFGVGAFHRSHLAVYIHALMNKKEASDWGICGVGVTSRGAAKRNKMLAQDCLYTVVERSAAVQRPRIIGSITQYMDAPSNSEGVIAKLADASTHIVSLTLTGSGYFIDEVSGELDKSHPDIAWDLANKGAAPKTVYGYLAAALARRREAGLRPFTVMSCDNLPSNGNRTRDMLLAFTQHIDPQLAEWIAANGAFPNSMVDRITPQTTSADENFLAEAFGIEDTSLIVAEDFTQFVIEDRFSDGRPDWAKVGVQMVTDVGPYGKMKQRLLNASHSAMSYLGHLSGYEYAHDVIGDPMFRTYIRAFMDNEALILPEVPGINVDAYCNTLIERFGNPSIGDRVLRLCRNGSGKIPKFILASVSEHVAVGGDTKLLSLCVAAWMRYLTGTGEKGEVFSIEDPKAAELQQLAIAGGADPTNLLTKSGLFSEALLASPTFVAEVTAALASLYKEGARATLAQYV